MKEFIISQEKADYLRSAKAAGEYANHICNAPSNPGSVKSFRIDGTDEIIELRCTQAGGMFSGTHCYILAS